MSRSGGLREALKAGQVLVGGWIQIPHPAVAELLASSGLDWVAVDVEHGAISLPESAQLFRAISACGSVPLVRLPGNEYPVTKRYLDAGAMGAIAPFINTREDAEQLVRCVKYPPLGARGAGYCVANRFGFEFADYFARANDEILTCVQIEHITAIENLDEILAVPEVDAAFIGPYDLTASMGITGEFDHPQYKRALERFLHCCQEQRVAAGTHVVQPNPQEVVARAEEGYRLIAYSLDVTLLGTACRTGVAQIRSALGRRPE